MSSNNSEVLDVSETCSVGSDCSWGVASSSFDSKVGSSDGCGSGVGLIGSVSVGLSEG